MATPDWYLDERAYAGPEHLDAAYVATYDAKAATDPAADVALLRGLGLGADDTLVDLGAGTGTFALAAAPWCRRVVAVDVSPAMVAALRARVAAQGLTNVTVVQAGFLSYAHAGPPAAFVYSRHALHHLPAVWKAIALRRIAAILRPGGVFHLRDLIYCCDLEAFDAVIGAWLAAAPDSPGAGWTRAELVTHLRTEYSPFSWVLEPMLAQAGFAIRERQVAASRVHAAYTCVKTG